MARVSRRRRHGELSTTTRLEGRDGNSEKSESSFLTSSLYPLPFFQHIQGRLAQRDEVTGLDDDQLGTPGGFPTQRSIHRHSRWFFTDGRSPRMLATRHVAQASLRFAFCALH